MELGLSPAAGISILRKYDSDRRASRRPSDCLRKARIGEIRYSAKSLFPKPARRLDDIGELSPEPRAFLFCGDIFSQAYGRAGRPNSRSESPAGYSTQS